MNATAVAISRYLAFVLCPSVSVILSESCLINSCLKASDSLELRLIRRVSNNSKQQICRIPLRLMIDMHT